MLTRRPVSRPSPATAAVMGLFAVFVLASLTVVAAEAGAPPDDGGQLTLVYVPNESGGITEINTSGNVVFGTAPWRHGSNGGLAFTPDGRRMYVSDHEASSVTVFDTATNVPLQEIEVGLHPIGVAITPDGSFVYVANQHSGTVSVIATHTNTVVKTISTGNEPIWVTISPHGSRAYVSNQNSGTLSIISTASNTVIQTVFGFASPFHSAFAPGDRFLWVSSQGDGTVKVLDTNGNSIVNSISAGPIPRGIAFTPDGSRAYVANFGSNTLTVINAFSQSPTGSVNVGNNPWNLAITPSGIAYVANFGDSNISVVDTSTNMVTATLLARSGPADVTITRRARPLALNFDFTLFDVPGSTNTQAQGVNDLGEIVGRYVAGGIGHGFLRRRDGSFETVDPPGAVDTVALGINNFGVVVGQYTDAGNVTHGFRHDRSGNFTTFDFPGAVDTALIANNNVGDQAGEFDFGDPSTGTGFLRSRTGMLTSFQVPGAVSLTQPNGITDFNQISGLFNGADGNFHGFLRRPKDGSFVTFDFPLAENALPFKLNKFDFVTGSYGVADVNHGFVLSAVAALLFAKPIEASQFLSLDVPDSRQTIARGINFAGQIVGRVRTVTGGPFHGFIATPRAGTLAMLVDN